MAERMIELAAQQPGFLGVESARTPDGLGITYPDFASAIIKVGIASTKPTIGPAIPTSSKAARC